MAAELLASGPWAFGYLLPQRGTFALALASLSGYSPYPLLLTVAAAAALRARWALLLAVLLAAAQLVTLAPAYVGSRADADGRPTLTVMTSNLRFGRADAAQIVRAVREHHVDVLATEELTTHAVERLQAAGLRTLLPYFLDHSAFGTTGTGLWSRLPLEEAPQRALTFQSCTADVVVGGHSVRIRAVHPAPPLGGPPGAWAGDFAALQEQVVFDRRIPTLIMGDFNASVHHRALRRLMGQRWRDAAEVNGAGLVRTFSPRAGLPALLDPDHVLVDAGMSVLAWRTLHIRGTDHRAVVVDLAVR
jgi:endonuclease/exonuclease/phosphatase (EEP) superfamily protein YafD